VYSVKTTAVDQFKGEDMAICRQVVSVSLGLLAVASIASATDITGAVSFVGITPCRIIETRAGQGFSGQAGPPSLVANATRTFQITGTVPGVPTQCGIPTTAVAISVNFTATGFTAPGDLRVFPAGATLPLVSILNYQLENIANATTVPLGAAGISVRADSAATDFIADVNGYYVARPFTTLESGKTLKGTYAIDFPAAGAGQEGTSAISFPIPLASAPSAVLANIIPAGGAATANCPGSSTLPSAAAGHVCVYEVSATNVSSRCMAGVAGSWSCGVAAPFGTTMWITATAAGSRTVSVGTWAVTAP
jgi:hypothetical protein